MTDYILYLALFILFFVLGLWALFARPPRGLSPVEYRGWYRRNYLNSFYWYTFSRARRAWSLGLCAHWWRGGCSGPRQVHHAKWTYRYLFWEWLPHVWLFGMRVLCERHHKRLHK